MPKSKQPGTHDLTDEELLGSFANAFRVLDLDESECLLDFCLYSARENRAAVVTRVRVPASFLASIQARLDEVLFEISDTDPPERCRLH